MALRRVLHAQESRRDVWSLINFQDFDHTGWGYLTTDLVDGELRDVHLYRLAPLVTWVQQQGRHPVRQEIAHIGQVRGAPEAVVRVYLGVYLRGARARRRRTRS